MRTPAGKNCRHYYQDFHRGRSIQECRLIKSNSDSLPWRPSDCSRCIVPEILNANSSPNLELTLTARPRLLGLRRRLEISALCSKHHQTVTDPYTGCEECSAERPSLDVFRQALERRGEDD